MRGEKDEEAMGIWKGLGRRGGVKERIVWGEGAEAEGRRRVEEEEAVEEETVAVKHQHIISKGKRDKKC